MDQYRMETRALPPRSRSGDRAGRRRLGGARRSGGDNNKKFRFFTWKWFLLVLLTTILLVVGGCSAVMMSAPTYDMSKIQENMDQSSIVYDAEGKEVMKLGGENREYVKLSDIKSPELAEAFIKVEDERFRQHNGIDYRGFARAIYRNIISLGKAEGASTITMQVARNSVLNDRTKTYTRKLSEIAVALNLERSYSKDDILETYINFIDFGNGVKGVKMAAKIYFDKDITKEELEPQEIALLAGLPKAPYGYNPYKYEEKAINRRNVVLNKLAETTKYSPPLITEAEAEEGKQKPLGVDPEYIQKHVPKNAFSAYKDYVLNELEKRYPGIPEEDITNGGIKVYTALNVKAQKAAEKALKDEENQFFVDKAGNPLEGLDAGLTIMDPTNGEIVAMGGGRKYMTGYMNRATQRMQPGSTIKPISVFAPAVEMGMNEYTIVKDEEMDIGGYTPRNYTGQYYGDIEMKEAVARSLNASTVWLLTEHVKLNRSFDYATKAGLKLEEKDKGSIAAMALGGLTKGVHTVEMAQAYSAFPNNGVNHEPHTIRKVEDREGKEVAPARELEMDREVYQPQTAWYVTRMLQNAIESDIGTGRNAQLDDGRPVAGKTGTTQNSKEAWFVGYTPQYVGAVAVFNDKGGEVRLTGGDYPAKIWRAVMSEVMAGLEVKNFDPPPGVKEPEPPFQLKPVGDLVGGFDANAQVVNLKWTDLGERVKYEVQRSEDNQNWSSIGEAEGGGFTDQNIEIPQGNFLQDFFGGGAQPKSYFYRVIAIDKEGEGDDARAEPSNVVEVKVAPKQEEQPPEEEQQDQPGEQDQQGDQQDQQGDQLDQQGDQIIDQSPDQQGGRQGGRGGRNGDDGSDQEGDEGGQGWWP
jgi:penicillin-binding protein 2A